MNNIFCVFLQQTTAKAHGLQQEAIAVNHFCGRNLGRSLYVQCSPCIPLVMCDILRAVAGSSLQLINYTYTQVTRPSHDIAPVGGSNFDDWYLSAAGAAKKVLGIEAFNRIASYLTEMNKITIFNKFYHCLRSEIIFVQTCLFNKSFPFNSIITIVLLIFLLIFYYMFFALLLPFLFYKTFVDEFNEWVCTYIILYNTTYKMLFKIIFWTFTFVLVHIFITVKWILMLFCWIYHMSKAWKCSSFTRTIRVWV